MTSGICSTLGVPYDIWKQHDQFNTLGFREQNTKIDARDLQHWVTHSSNWAAGGSDAIARWPQLACPLFQMQLVTDEYISRFADRYVHSSASVAERNAIRMIANLPATQQKLQMTMALGLQELVNMKSDCWGAHLDGWIASARESQKDHNPEDIPDLCVAAIYYLSSYLRVQTRRLNDSEFSAEVRRFHRVDTQKDTARERGIGMMFEKIDGGSVIVQGFADLTADYLRAAGLQAGREILAINGTPVNTMSEEDFIRAAAGNKGSSVTLTIREPGEAPRDITFERRYPL